MPTKRSLNDAILEPFLLAQDLGESQAQLVILISEYAEPRIRGIVIGRLRGYLNSQQYNADYEDVCSEAKTRLVIYLRELKADLTAGPCKDFLSYASSIAHTVCHDYFRQRYPARARLDKKIRDLLKASSRLGLWRYHDKASSEWACGFDAWRGMKSSPNAGIWLDYLLEDTEAVSDTFSSLGDTQRVKIDDLLTSIFQLVGEPLRVTDVVDLVAHLRGIKDNPALSLDSNDRIVSFRLSDSRLRIDSVLEIREPLERVWQGISELPGDERTCPTISPAIATPSARRHR